MDGWRRWRRRRHLPAGYRFSEAFCESEGLFFYEHRAEWWRHGAEDHAAPYNSLAWDVTSDSSYRVALGGGGSSADTVRRSPPEAEELLARFASGQSLEVFWLWEGDREGVGRWWGHGWADPDS
jgi:hypothetical protein